MEMRAKILLGAAIAASSAAPAYAQAIPSPFGSGQTISASTSSTTTLGSSTTTQTGDSTTSPYANTITTVQTQTVGTSATGGTSGTVMIGSWTSGYSLTASGSSGQTQTVTTALTTTYNPGTPPTISSTVSSGPTVANVGTASVTAVTVAGSAGIATPTGATPLVGANIASSGTPTAAGTVNVTENDYAVTTSGVTFSKYTGTATYTTDSTGAVGTVTISPLVLASSSTYGSGGMTTSAGAASTTVAPGGVTTTGSIVAGGSITGSSLTLAGTGDHQIHGLAAGTAATDAVNVGQMNSAISAALTPVNASITTLNSLVLANQKRSDAGIATAVALSGGMFLPGKKVNFTANVGAYRDEVAIAGSLGILVSDSVALNAGVATSFHSYGGTSVRGGFTFGF